MISARELKHLDPDALRLYRLYERGQHPPLLTGVDELSKSGRLKPEVLGVAALALTALERYEEAYSAAQAAVNQQPNSAWLHAALSGALVGQGAHAEAVTAQRMATQLAPGEGTYLAALSRLYRQTGEKELALRTARQALVIDPANASAMVELGLGMKETGSPEAALEQFRLAQVAAPDNPVPFLEEGALRVERGEKDQARIALHGALKRKPGLTEAENRLADTLVRSGPLRWMLGHLLTMARVSIIGWVVIAFFYYLGFRLLQFIWGFFPVLLPAFQALLLGALYYLLGMAVLGHLLRLTMRMGWPR